MSKPAFQALFVTFLWSTSWVLIKVGLEEIPPLTFAGLRYSIAAALLIVVVVSRRSLRTQVRSMDRRAWAELALLGAVMYGATQGLQFLALSLLPANTVSLVLSFTPAVVAIVGAVSLRESMTALQGAGIVAMLLGAGIFLLPIDRLNVGGLVVACVGTAANASAAILGRLVNRRRHLRPISITTGSMTIGALLLLSTGLATEPAPVLSLTGWAIVLWLAGVNTAFAFVLWNNTLRRLNATTSAVINNTMLAQIALLAWIFLDERPPPWRFSGIIAMVVGMIAVTAGSPLPLWAHCRRGRSESEA